MSRDHLALWLGRRSWSGTSSDCANGLATRHGYRVCAWDLPRDEGGARCSVYVACSLMPA